MNGEGGGEAGGGDWTGNGSNERVDREAGGGGDTTQGVGGMREVVEREWW